MAFKMNNPLKHKGYNKHGWPFKDETDHENFHDDEGGKDAETGGPLNKFKMNPSSKSLFGKKPMIESEFEVIKVELEDGIAGEANNDGTIFVDQNIEDGSIEEAEVVAHEGKHMKDMEEGVLGYSDDHVEYKGKKYERKDGKIKYNGKWVEEGYKDFPWEKTAYKEGDAAVKQLKKQYGK
tara:strand:+ start:40 stop:579 length:540 start_codon:yes stop_codon:yes gene_type:complete